MRFVDGLAQKPLQPVPGGEDLPQRTLADHPSVAVDGDAFFDLDPEIADAGAASLQRLDQFGMHGDPGAAADQFDARALVTSTSQPIWRRNAALNRPDIEPPMMTARRLRIDHQPSNRGQANT